MRIDSEIRTIIEEILAKNNLDPMTRQQFLEILVRNDLPRNNKSDVQESAQAKVREGGHFSTLRSKITDAELLIKTLRDLGIAVKREADVRGDNGQRVRADIVAVLEGEFDLGWSRNDDGTFDFIADLWGVAKKHNQTELVNSIHQKYRVNKTIKEAKERGLNRGK